MPLDYEPTVNWLLFALAMVLSASLWLYMALDGHYGPVWVHWTGYVICLTACLWAGYRAGNALRGPK